MQPDPLPQLSPELVLILPPEVAAIAQMTLPTPAGAVADAAPRRTVSLKHVAGICSLYAFILALTITPLGLAMKAAPSRHARALRAHDELRADRNHPH